MKIFSQLGRAAGSWLGLPAGIMPTASLPGLTAGEQLPQVRVVAASANPAPAPVAGLKRTTMAELGLKITPEMLADAIARQQVQAATRASWKPGPPIAKPVAKSITPSTDTDDVPAPPPPAKKDDDESDPALDSIVKQMEDLLAVLKRRVAPDASDDVDEQAAAALFKTGRKQSAFKLYSLIANRLCARGAAREKLPTMARVAASFDEQASVRALTAALTPRTVATVKPSADPIVRHREIDTEIRALDKLQQSGFSNERNAKHAALRREQSALRKQFQAQAR